MAGGGRRGKVRLHLLDVAVLNVVRIVGWRHRAATTELRERLDVVVDLPQLLGRALERLRNLLVEHPQICLLLRRPCVAASLVAMHLQLREHRSKVVEHSCRPGSVGTQRLGTAVFGLQQTNTLIQRPRILLWRPMRHMVFLWRWQDHLT